jgi:DNA-binding response OmpR family regulator
MPLILIVDDDFSTQDVLTRRFRRSGFDVCQAGSIGDGHRQLQQRKPDLIILDLRLPDGDGLDFASDLFESQVSNLPPIVCHTSDARDEVRTAAMQLGCAGYVTKPSKYQDLLAMVQNALGSVI